MELEGIEPSSARRLTTALRPFPRSSLFGWLTAGSAGLRHPPRLSEEPAFFLAVSVLSRRQPPLLLPGCGGQAPCAIAGHDVSLHLTRCQAARAKSPSALLWVPRLTSLRNSGRTSGFRSPRRNRSAPCQRTAHGHVVVSGGPRVPVLPRWSSAGWRRGRGLGPDASTRRGRRPPPGHCRRARSRTRRRAGHHQPDDAHEA